MAAVVVTVAGVDVTDDVVFSTAQFKSLVNGKPGEAKMRVRDLASTYSFTQGADWLLTVNGDAVWRGFVQTISRVYIYSAGDTAESGLQRFWDLEGADLNILFPRRVVFKGSSPTTVEGTQFAAGTADTTAITDLLANWLDLSSDDLDTTTGVVGVGDLDPAQKTRAWSGGWYWDDAMNSIAMLPAAIYYIRPETGSPKGTLVYCDVDVPDAPFGLSDVPNGTTTRGFREAEIILDGTSLANDVMGWGMGYGSQTPVFKRDEDATSQTAHGLWQTGRVVPGVYKQATIDRITDSIINGSPQSKRGAKDDRPAVQLVTYEPGLLVGHKVPFTSNVWGWSDTLPVRQMQVTFETPTDPRYELILSHEIDAPWGFIDQFWPKIPRFPGFSGGWFGGGWTLPGGECDCGITDTFTRTVASDWGTSDAGIVWATSLGSGTASVDGDQGVMTFTKEAGDQTVQELAGAVPSPIVSAVFQFKVSEILDYSFFPDYWRWTEIQTLLGGQISFGINTSLVAPVSGNNGGCLWLGAGSDDVVVSKTDWSAGTLYSARIEYDKASSIHRMRVWTASGTEPATWDITRDPSSDTAFTDTIFAFYTGTDGNGGSDPVGTYTVYFDNLDINDVDRCTAVQFDDFERTVASGWGTATPIGESWSASGVTYTSAVSNGEGRITDIGGSGGGIMVASLPAELTGSFEMLANVRANRIPTGRFEYCYFIFDLGGNKRVGLAMSTSSARGSVDLGSDWVVKTNWTTGVYAVRMNWDSTTGLLKVKVWLVSSVEPSDWLLETTESGAIGTDITVQYEGGGTVGDTGYFLSIDFDYDGKPCYYVDGVPVYAGAGGTNLPFGPTGFGCEGPTRTSSTIYTMSQSYRPGSTFVWRDGLFQRRGTDYTEDSGNLTVTFSDAVESTSVIRACYFAEAI